MKITINGREHEVGNEIDYATVVRLALDLDSESLQTVIYDKRLTRDTTVAGSLTPGESVRVIEGMDFDVAYTGSA